MIEGWNAVPGVVRVALKWFGERVSLRLSHGWVTWHPETTAARHLAGKYLQGRMPSTTLRLTAVNVGGPCAVSDFGILLPGADDPLLLKFAVFDDKDWPRCLVRRGDQVSVNVLPENLPDVGGLLCVTTNSGEIMKGSRLDSAQIRAAKRRENPNR